MKIRLIGLVVFLLLFIGELSAKVALPAIFSDNMVLQQQSVVLIWGKADINKTVTIKNNWNSKIVSEVADENGTWKAKVETPVAGGPYELVISDGEDVRLKNILIGEVWFCSGQSNMDIPMRGVGKNVTIKDSEKYIAGGTNPKLRLFKVEHNRSEVPLADVKGRWLEASPESVAGFSAVGYLFGKQLQESLGVPVGMIKSAVSSTTIAAWMSEKLLRESFGIPMGTKAGKANAAELFNAMISPLAGYGIKGFLWYQGEGNHGASELYARQLPALVKEWRTLWGQGELPFYYVQIAPYSYSKRKDKLTHGADLLPYYWEAQAKCLAFPHSGMAVTTDLVDDLKNIHPSYKWEVGRRLSLWALAKDYGQDLVYSGPLYKSMKVKGHKIELQFTETGSGLNSNDGKELNWFMIAGADRKFYPATATIKGNKLMVTSPEVKKPVAVRFAWDEAAMPNFCNKELLPASSFRTDNW